MLTSGQVSALINQQNQTFMGASQYAHVISSQMPGIYGNTLSAYGVGSPPTQQFQQNPYGPSQRAGFSYGGPTFNSYGLGNQIGAGAMSAMGGMGQAALGIGGIAAGMGMIGGPLGMMLDPFRMGSMAFGGARAMGMGMAGSLGMGAMGMGVGMLPGMAVSHGLGNLVTGAQEQSNMDRVLGQFNFGNSASRTGRGFNRNDSMVIGQMTRELQAIPEMMTSMSELSRIMDKLGQMGSMQGVRDAQEFGRKFKESITVLKDISKVMGTTMEEAIPFFQQAKMSGFYNPSQIKQNMVQRQLVGSLTGMDQSQVGALQMQGSQLNFAMGGTRMSGSKSALRVAAELGTANQMGILSNEKIQELTGEEGAAGIQQLSSTVNEVGYRMGKSSLGTAMTLALGEVKEGRYTGNMDSGLVSQVRQGLIGKSELLRIAHQKAGSRTAKLSFAAHRQKLTSEMVSQTGAQGIMMELQTILGERGWDNPDALNLVMQRYGVDEHQATQLIELGKEMPKIQAQMTSQGEVEGRRIAEQTYLRDNASWEGIKKKMGKKFENALSEPFRKLGASIRNSIQESVDDFVDEIFGRYSNTVTQEASGLMTKADMGSTKAQQEIKSIQGGMPRKGGKTSIMQGTLWEAATAGIGKGLNLLGGVSTLEEQADIISKSAGGGASYLKGLEGSSELDKLGGLKGVRALSQSVRNQLISNSGLAEEGITETQKFERLRDAMPESDLKAARKAAGVSVNDSSKDIAILAAASKQGGTSGFSNMFSASSLGSIMEGGLTSSMLPVLAEERKSQIDTAAGDFGSQKDLVKNLLTKGGDSAKFLYGYYESGSKNRDQLENIAFSSGSLSSDQKQLLSSMGISPDQIGESRGDLAKIIREGGRGTNANMSYAHEASQRESVAMLLSRRKEMGIAMGERLSSFDDANKKITDKGSTDAKMALMRLRAISNRLTHEEGLSDNNTFGDVASDIANTKGSEREALLMEAPGSVHVGVAEIEEDRRKYKSMLRRKGGKLTAEDLGYTDVGLEKRGITGDARNRALEQIKGITHGGIIGKDQESEIEKVLANAKISSLNNASGSKQGTTAASQLSDVLTKVDGNMDKITTILQALATGKKPGEMGQEK